MKNRVEGNMRDLLVEEEALVPPIEDEGEGTIRWEDRTEEGGGREAGTGRAQRGRWGRRGRTGEGRAAGREEEEQGTEGGREGGGDR